MNFQMPLRLIASLFIFILATPTIAERLEPNWQNDRDKFNKLSDQACAGDGSAYSELFSHAKLKENPVALNDLGWLLSTQRCEYSKKDLTFAAIQYRLAADAGYPLGLSNYAEYLMEGEGVRRDPDLAKDYFHRAIGAGYGNAAVTLGLYYLSAEFLPIDDTKARSLYNRAIDEGADSLQLEKLAAELEKLEANGEFEMSEIDERQRFFTDAWGYGYGEARWDYAPKGKFNSRVYVGVFDDTKRFYLGMMRDTHDPIVRLTGVTIEYANESVYQVDLSFCQNDTCTVSQYGDNFGEPGSFISITLPISQQNEVLEALKSARYVVFHYQTKSGGKKNTLGLRGSRKAIETLERKNGLSSESNGNTGAWQEDDSAYRAALRKLTSELTLVWSTGEGSPQPGRQSFEPTTTPCLIQTFVQHPNTGKTSREFDLGALDPNQITWEEDFFFGKAEFFTVNTLGNRKATKLLTNYPDGNTEFENTEEVALYIGENGNYEGIRPILATAIRHCNRRAQQ